MRNLTASLALAAALLAAAPSHARPADAGTAKKILKDSVAFPTVEGRGQVPALAAYYADVLKAAGFADADIVITRSDERRVGQECGGTCRCWWSPSHKKQKIEQTRRQE